MPTSLFTIAVTGSAGSGKSLVCRRLAHLGVPQVSCDDLARQVTAAGSDGLERIRCELGEEWVGPDGRLDRRRVRALISANRDARRQLEAIVQPLIVSALFEKLDRLSLAGHAVAAAEVPLLFELGLADRFDLILLVTAGPDVLARRVALRDGGTIRDAQALLDLQMSQDQKREMADVVIENAGSITELEQAVDHFYLCRLAAFS